MVYVLMWLEAVYRFVYRLYMQQKDIIDFIDASKIPTNNNTTYRLMNYSTTTKGHSRPKQASKHNSVSNCRWAMCEWALTVVTRKDPCLGYGPTHEVRRPMSLGSLSRGETMKNKENPLDIEKSLGFLNSQLPTSNLVHLRKVNSSIWISSPWKNRYAMHFLYLLISIPPFRRFWPAAASGDM